MPDCRAEIRIHDDRWGIFTDRCRLEEGHEGDHRTPRTACEPVAYLGWAEPEHNDGHLRAESPTEAGLSHPPAEADGGT